MTSLKLSISLFSVAYNAVSMSLWLSKKVASSELISDILALKSASSESNRLGG